MAKKFNLAELVPEMGAVSESGAPRITMIPIEQLRPNAGNFYDTSNLDDLEDSIALHGLLEPLCVIRRRQGTGDYVIFSGHRRYRAIRRLYEKSRFLQWKEVPCIVYPDPQDKNRETVMLIHANSTGRVLSNWEKAQQARRLKEALVAMKRDGAELPGRIRDIVAEEMKLSAAKVARLEAIGNNLRYPGLQRAWERGELGESVAYELSKLSYDEQLRVADRCIEEGIPHSKLSVKDVARLAGEEDTTTPPALRATSTPLSVACGDISPRRGESSPYTGEALESGEASESGGGNVSNLNTIPADAKGGWRRCLVDEPAEGEMVLVVDPAVAAMPDICRYLDWQFADDLGNGDALEVKSYWLWLPLPPFPEEGDR